MAEPLDAAVERVRHLIAVIERPGFNATRSTEIGVLVDDLRALLAALDSQPPTRTEGEGLGVDEAVEFLHWMHRFVPDDPTAARPAPPEPEPDECSTAVACDDPECPDRVASEPDLCAGTGRSTVRYGSAVPAGWACPICREPVNIGAGTVPAHLTPAPAPVPEERREAADRLLSEVYSRTPETADWLDLNDRIAAHLRSSGVMPSFAALSSSPAAPGGGEAGAEVDTHVLRLAAECGIDGDGVFRWERPLPEILTDCAAEIDHLRHALSQPPSPSAAPGEQYEPVACADCRTEQSSRGRDARCFDHTEFVAARSAAQAGDA